jgi:hypothetical protein
LVGLAHGGYRARDDEHCAFVGIEVLVRTRLALELQKTGVAYFGAATLHVSIEAFLVREDAYTVAFGVVDLSRPAAGGALGLVALAAAARRA